MNRLSYARPSEAAQLALPLAASKSDDDTERTLGVTFRDSLVQPVFGWYPYVEGFSAKYTSDTIATYRPKSVYDPFAGSGTTQLAASCVGIPSFYCEVNPFMRFVAETKVNAAAWAHANLKTFQRICREFVSEVTSPAFSKLAREQSLASYERAFPERDFFETGHLKDLLAAVNLAREIGTSPQARDILLLACAANAVASSNMTRRADLRRRRDDEYKDRVVDVPQQIAATATRFMRDVERVQPLAEMTFVSPDARRVTSDFENRFELALTSPPYLNGTNYFRNTKIELWLLGFIASERELGGFRRDAISAGINNVTRARPTSHRFDPVEKIVTALEATDGDMRIPLLVRQYCSDMHEMFVATRQALRRDGVFLLDIGDSKFYGVHVPTDTLLIHVAEQAGLSLKVRRVLARRHSRDKSELVQVELVLTPRSKQRRAKPSAPNQPAAAPQRESGATKPGSIEARIAEFERTLPYRPEPYCKRNWGHALHSLCSYQGKLKPAMAHWLVREFVPEGGRVLDPLGGVGTIPFEAALLGRDAVSNDMSPLAATVGSAKLDPPSLPEFEKAATSLLAQLSRLRVTAADRQAAEFGLNGAVREFFHEETLAEVLKARKLFLSQDKWTRAETFFWACLLHVLHGNRPYALSRTSHPITPFRPTGPFVQKSLEEKVRARARAVLGEELPKAFRAGRGLRGDFRLLDSATVGHFDAVITSPPFIGMRFDRPNWLRLWFCGWGESDFHETSLGFLERQQTASRDCYSAFFATMHRLLKATGTLIMHVGSGGAKDLVGDLRKLGEKEFQLVGEVVENVQEIEQHGLPDKGLTSHHHLLFFSPR